MQAVPALNVCAIGAEISSEQPGCGQFVFVQTKLRQSSTASNTEKCRQLPIEPIFVQPLARVRTEITIGGFFRCKSLLVPFEDSEFAAFSLTDGDIIQGCVILSMSKCAEERILQDIVLLTVT